MREIKFRAWDKVKKIMRSSVLSLSWLYGESLNDISVDTENGPEDGNIDNFIIMQYTGLKDKNGREIYEGDIVHLWNKYSDDGIKHDWGKWEVYFCGDRWRLKNGDIEYDNGDYYHGYEVNWGDNNTSFIEVVGNIFENPEILKEQG